MVILLQKIVQNIYLLTDFNCMASPDHVMSDHAYGIPSPKQQQGQGYNF